MVRLSADGGFIYNQYVQPQGNMEATLPGCSITAAPKTEKWKVRRARQALKAIDGADHLMQRVQAACFVRAEAHWVLGAHGDAVQAWHQCAQLEQSKELAMLCAYRLALLAGQHNVVEAAKIITALEDTINMHSCSPALCWYAALTAYHAGDYDRSKEWALQAAHAGCHSGICMPEGRIRYEEARHELPYDVLHFALVQLGDSAGAQKARQDFQIAWTARQQPKPIANSERLASDRTVADVAVV